MLQRNQKSTGTDYTATIAFVFIAAILSPAVLLLSGPVSTLGLVMATTVSLVCLGLGWNSWRRHSRLSIPSIEGQS